MPVALVVLAYYLVVSVTEEGEEVSASGVLLQDLLQGGGVLRAP